MKSYIDLETKKKLFPVYANLYLKPKNLIRNQKEWRASKGLLHQKTTQPSTLLFTTHKCASTFFSKFLHEVEQETSFVHINYDSFFAGQQVPVEKAFESNDFLAKGFNEQGFIYGPMRSNRDIPNKQAYKNLLILRDPRDVMVSLFYSMRYSHSLISKGMISIRQEAEKHDVDSYVYLRAQEFREKYDSYKELLVQNYNTLYLRYDDLIDNPETSLKKIIDFIGVELHQETFKELANQLKPSDSENIYTHKRSGRSGQFKEKLKTETIDFLNQEFEEIIPYFGFPI